MKVYRALKDFHCGKTKFTGGQTIASESWFIRAGKVTPEYIDKLIQSGYLELYQTNHIIDPSEEVLKETPLVTGIDPELLRLAGVISEQTKQRDQEDVATWAHRLTDQDRE